ncbi:hypothetical protein LA345_25885 [Burkholderia vietnamiensis]|uniref:Uncharacterized protein n=1 Tax=Burkholderia vietnamiensis (strain G4 / LMG 22486) TaxID=269482 RepID=A4JD33_BURVG|nr:hypothetical protein [Burkholderia vietnamiensis]ABO54186.1 hypothetical protein Bcep1808_1175 [Burkholderia vietnamiensis G4]MCB4347318.1 hypothetical protein [Burkholderia vietnamiensis]
MTVPSPQTPSDIITLALKTANVLGVGQVAAAEDMNDAFNLMNMMMAQWQRRRYMVYQLITVSKQATGAVSYTVGPGGDFNIARPAKLEFAYFRQNANTPLPVSYPLVILRAREDYDRISIKDLNAFPRYAFYDAGYPMANLFVWPIPNAQYEIDITVMQQLQQFATINDQIALPPEYAAALMWNLTLELYPFYGLPVSPVVQGKAEASMRIIEEVNAQIPLLQMPTALRGNNTGTYNIYGDQYIGSSP